MVRQYTVRPREGQAAVEVSPCRSGIDYQRELNPAQYEAVRHLDGPALVIAGAGTGKTRTLTYRVAHMVDQGVAPESILLLTFTRKAAEQMLGRAAKLVGLATNRVAGGTFHAFACNVLRRHGSDIGLHTNFTILDEGDAADTIQLVRDSLDLPPSETRFPTKAALRDMLSKSINRGIPVATIIEREYGHFAEHAKTILGLLETYCRYKFEHQLLDYDDLLIHLEMLLDKSPATRAQLAARHRYIMVDEYQDTNALQGRITQRLGQEHGNVMVVGDDAQSIYGFRGACVENILAFPQLFPGARVIRLEQNYRSTQRILDAANRLIGHATQGYEKTLHGVRGTGELPALVPCADEEQQASFIAQRILELRNDGVPLSQQAVLFRSGFHAWALEIELNRRKIPFVKWGGFKFIEAAHVKDVMAHLRVVANPTDRVSWQRVLSLLPGCGAKTITTLIGTITANKEPFTLEQLPAKPRVREGLTKLGPVLRELAANTMVPTAMIDRVCDYYLPLLPDRFPDDHPTRRRDLDHLSVLAGKYNDLTTMLSDLAIEPPNRSVAGIMAPDDDNEDRLVLSTIHSAKGMEWHSVFVLWLLEGRFPTFQSLKDAAGLEEERRLCYVAITRAQENLALLYPATAWDRQSGGVLTEPSRFVREIGGSSFELWQLTGESPRQPRGGAGILSVR